MTEETKNKLTAWEYINKNNWYGGKAVVDKGRVTGIKYWSSTMVDLPEIKVKKAAL